MPSVESTATALPVRKAVVPAAGLGTRLRPLTHTFPKELLPIGREPILARVMAELQAAGLTEVLFVVSARKPQIRAFFGEIWVGDEALSPLRCDYVTQEEQRGSGHAVLCAETWVGDEPFVVAFGDCLIDVALNSPFDKNWKQTITASAAPLRRMIATWRMHRPDALVLVEQVPREQVSRYGVVAPAEPLPEPPIDPFAMVGMVEKPHPQEAPSGMAAAARLLFSPVIFGALRTTPPDARGEWNLPDAIQSRLAQGGTAWAVPLREGEARRDIGNLQSFLTEFVRAALRDPDFGEAARKAAQEVLASQPPQSG